MPVKTTEHAPRAGVAELQPSGYLAYKLIPEGEMPRNAIFTFSCHSRRDMLSISNSIDLAFYWYLGEVPPSSAPGAQNHFFTDKPGGIEDYYVVALDFAQCPRYRLQIFQLPGDTLLRDESYEADAVTDTFTTSLPVFSSAVTE